MSIKKVLFGKTKDGNEVWEYLLQKGGVTLGILNYGATIHQLLIPCKGEVRDVVGGYDTVKEYEDNDGYQGALIGRVGNRIKEGVFKLACKKYSIFVNNGPNSLHGGKIGFDKYLWEVETESGEDFERIHLSILSPDMDEGYPGNLKVKVSYTLHGNASFSIRYQADTDKKTVVNLTNHSYFNLTGFAPADILQHKLTLSCSHFIPVDENLIPTGQIAPVEGTPFDFRMGKTVGQDIELPHEQLILGGGYDHSFAVDRVNPVDYDGKTLYSFATLTAPDGSLSMKVATDQPGVQVYCGNFLHDDICFKKGIPQKRRSALCLETQHHPDSPNQKNFPSVVLKPEDHYDTVTLFSFAE